MHHQVETNEHVVLHDDDAVVAHGAAISSCFVRDALSPQIRRAADLPGLTQNPPATGCGLLPLVAALRGRQFGGVPWRLSTQVAARRGNVGQRRARKLQPRRRGAGGGTRTPTGIAALRIFLPATAFTALVSRHRAGRRVCGLDYPFTVLRTGENPPEGRCCPSSLYTFPSRRLRGRLSGLGSGLPRTRFPRVWAVLHP